MNTFAKILVVFVLLLSCAFAVSQMMLYSKREHWREKAEIAEKGLKEQTDLAAGLQKDLAKTKSELSSAMKDWHEEVTTLTDAKKEREETIRKLESEKETLDSKLNQRDQRVTALEETVDRQTADIDRLKTEVDARKADLTSALDKVQKLEADVEQLNGNIEGLDKQVADLTDANRKLQDEAENLQGVLKELAARGVYIPGQEIPLVDARVARADNSLGAIVLNKGANDKVKVGLAFTVYRNQEFLAKVNVVQVDDEFSLALVDKRIDYKPIQIGDSATTQVQ